MKGTTTLSIWHNVGFSNEFIFIRKTNIDLLNTAATLLAFLKNKLYINNYIIKKGSHILLHYGWYVRSMKIVAFVTEIFRNR